MKAEDQFHLGIVTDNLDESLAQLSALFGYQWCEQMGGPTKVSRPDGDTVLDLQFAYSMSTPRLEVIQAVPGTMWEPADSGIHHIGYWSDDVPADSAELVRHGMALDAAGLDPNGAPYWVFHRSATGPRIELVSRKVQPMMEQYWATGKIPR